MSERYTLIDGHLRHLLSPRTFHLPSAADIAALHPGDFIKVGVKFKGGDGKPRLGERFWVLLHSVGPALFSGEINNDLVYSAEHGLACGDQLTVQHRHILQIQRSTGAGADG
jgi:hypothetical protein